MSLSRLVHSDIDVAGKHTASDIFVQLPHLCVEKMQTAFSNVYPWNQHFILIEIPPTIATKDT